jgi:hypothetical protein
VLTMNDRSMREHVLALVRRTLSEHGLPDRPTVAQVVSALNLPPPKIGRLAVGQDGLRSGRQIIISGRLTCRERQEFTAFHEIVHILIEEDGQILVELHEHFFHSSDQELNWKLEELCQLGAAEFVLPSDRFRGIMDENGWKLTAIEQAANDCSSSVVAAAFQYALYNPDPCTVLVCEYGVPPKAGEPGLPLDVAPRPCALHVAYAARHPDAYPMSRHVVIPSQHIVHRAWKDGLAVEGMDAGFFRNPRDWRMHCEVAPIRGRVYAAFYKRQPQRVSNQPSLFDLQ